jgi:tRNA(fMet)-specific endonuclease VapC
MSGEHLLDTNIVIRFFGHDTAVEEQLSKSPGVFLPVFALAELYYGAFKSNLTWKNYEGIEQFVSRIGVLSGDKETAVEFGRIKNELRLMGRPIPDNDIWIAALARRHDLVLVSGDRHFTEIANLRLDSSW